MSEAAAIDGARAVDPLALYRDDGPLARAIGRTAGGLVTLPPILLVVVGLLPMAVAVAAGRDGVPVAAAAATVVWMVLLGGIAAGRSNTHVLWGTPPALRAAEYGGLLWLASLAGDAALPAAFALLCVLAFRHYDLVYRLRFQGRTPPAWVGAVAGGWDGRLIAAAILLATGALAAGFFVMAALLGAVFVGESIAGWRRLDQTVQPVYGGEDEESVE